MSRPKSPRTPSTYAAAALDEKSRKPPPAGSATTGGISTSNVDIYEVPDDSVRSDNPCAQPRLNL